MGVVSYRNMNRLMRTAQLVHHSREVLVRLEDVLGDLTLSASKTSEKIEDLEPKVKERLARLEQMTHEKDDLEGDGLLSPTEAEGKELLIQKG